MSASSPITVDHGIPKPTRWQGSLKYPWRDLKPDDSFVWPGSVEQTRGACKQRRRRHGELYQIAKVTEDGKHLIRVWRIA